MRINSILPPQKPSTLNNGKNNAEKDQQMDMIVNLNYFGSMLRHDDYIDCRSIHVN